jgi:hypothetical protein
MQREDFGGIQILRPGVKTEIDVRTEAEQTLRSKHRPGSYTDSKIINGILQDHFQYFGSQLELIIPQLASRHNMEFVLHQYNLSCEIDGKAKQGSLEAGAHKRWIEVGPLFRRALKFLAERTVMLAPQESPQAPATDILGLIERLVSCTEQLVQFTSLSDQTYMLFPEETTLTISDQGEKEYIKLSLAKPIMEQMLERNMKDLQIRERYVPIMRALLDPALRQECLDEGFREVFGLTYQECKFILMSTIDAIDKANGVSGWGIPFVLQEQIVQTQCQHFPGVSPANIERLLDGFTITQENLLAEGRVIWKPKQEHRAYRRGFFQFPHPTGKHLTWSKGMAREALILLDRDLAFQHVPPEWNENPIKKAIALLSNRCGVEFERTCQNLLKQRGFEIATNFKDGIGIKPNRTPIPSDVGELDCLAYSSTAHLLILLEFKLIQSGTEPARFRDDLSQFSGKKGFFAKHKKKRQWLLDNLAAVTRALVTVPGAPAVIAPQSVGAAIITFYPSFASYFDEDALCLSVGEFFDGWDRAGQWPSSKAIYPVGGTQNSKAS